MVVPREHGAWGMMLVPLATGAIVALRSGVNGGALTLFIVAAMSLFWLRTPVEAWLGLVAIKAQTSRSARSCAQFSASPFSPLPALRPAVEWPQSRPAIDRQYCSPGLRDAGGREEAGTQGRMPAQVIGAIGLTSTAAGAYYVARKA